MDQQAIALCRVSTPEQKLNNSLNRQEENVLKEAHNLGVKIVKWWSGDVSSKAGTNLKRKDLKEIEVFCKKNRKVKYLIIDEPDRFMRSLDEAFYFEVLFRDLGVSVWYASDPALNNGDLMSKMLKFTKYFPAEGSNLERQTKSISGHEKAIREGRYTFPPKPGYMKGDKPGIHIHNPKTFKPLQNALKEVTGGIYSPQEALIRLNKSQFTKYHAKWRMDKFRNFAIDPYYAGILIMDKQVKQQNKKGLHEPMVSIKEYEELLRVFNGTKKVRGTRKQYNPEFPLSKILLCEDCNGIKFTGSKKNNGYAKRVTRYYWKYHCRGCGREYDRSLVHELLTKHLERVKYDSEQQEDFVEALEIVWKQKQRDKLKEIQLLKNRLEKLNTTKSKLVIELTISDEELKEDIKNEIEKTKLNISEIENNIRDCEYIDEDLIMFTRFGLNYNEELREDWWDLNYEDMVRCQQIFFPNSIFINSKKKVSTPQISPIYFLEPNKKDLRFSRKSLMVELVGITPTSEGLS
jgi:site-specific DNA recombinase